MPFLKHIMNACRLLAIPAAVILALPSCEYIKEDKHHVLILYSAGHNNLGSALAEDIRDLTLNMANSKANTLLIYSHRATSSSYQPSPSYLVQASKGSNSTLILDTLMTYPSATHSADAETLEQVLSYVKENFPADEYGMLFSSHGTGYLPEGYYTNASKYESSYNTSDGRAIQKTIGQETEGSTSYEIDLRDFAGAIPFQLDYIIFDACLMGGAEVAYQLRDKARYLVASPAEVLSDGMDYKTMTSYLFSSGSLKSRLKSFCENYFNHYNSLSGAYCSATISLINLNAMEYLAAVCNELFGKYRENLNTIQADEIQRFYSYNYHWFYDLGDIVSNLGCTEDELTDFAYALECCILYGAATETFLTGNPSNPYPGFVIEKYSGLSMYLPCNGGAYLDNYYKNLDWNIATGLVE